MDVGGRELAVGETVEPLIRSPATCIGYWKDPAATRAALEDGWLHTGDLVSRDAEGYYWFRAEKKRSSFAPVPTFRRRRWRRCFIIIQPCGKWEL